MSKSPERRLNASSLNASRLIAALLFALPTVSAIAQQPPPAPPSYDVISVRPHSTLDDNISFMSRPGIFTASNASLKGLISFAYGVREDLISGLPSWANSARFDVIAKVSDS